MRDLLGKRPIEVMDNDYAELPHHTPLSRPVRLGDTEVTDAYIRSVPGLGRALVGSGTPKFGMPLDMLLRGLVERFDWRENTAAQWKRRATSLLEFDNELRDHVNNLKRNHAIQLRSLRLEIDHLRSELAAGEDGEIRQGERRDTPDEDEVQERSPTEPRPSDFPPTGPRT